MAGNEQAIEDDGGGVGGGAMLAPRALRLLEPVAEHGKRRVPGTARSGARLSLPTREKMERFTEAKRRHAGVKAVDEANQFVSRCRRLAEMDQREADAARRAGTARPIQPHSGEVEARRRALALAAEMQMRRAVRRVQAGFDLAVREHDSGEALRMCNRMERLNQMSRSAQSVLGDRGTAVVDMTAARAAQMRRTVRNAQQESVPAQRDTQPEARG